MEVANDDYGIKIAQDLRGNEISRFSASKTSTNS